MDDLRQLYQQLILEHAKKPSHKVDSGNISDDTSNVIAGLTRNLRADDDTLGFGTSNQINATCGDEITMAVLLKDGTIIDLAWEGQGCSISQASASIMTELAANNAITDFLVSDAIFHELMSSKGKGLTDPDAEEKLGDAVVFTGVSQYPARIKCALLGWESLRGAILDATS